MTRRAAWNGSLSILLMYNVRAYCLKGVAQARFVGDAIRVMLLLVHC